MAACCLIRGLCLIPDWTSYAPWIDPSILDAISGSGIIEIIKRHGVVVGDNGHGSCDYVDGGVRFDGIIKTIEFKTRDLPD
ncbi:MAG: hypothetical protein ACPIA7_09785 [Akkermansiaceae bacterium]